MIGHVFHSTASGLPEVASSALLAAMFAAALIVVPLTPASRYPRIPHSGGLLRIRYVWHARESAARSIVFEHLDVASCRSHEEQQWTVARIISFFPLWLWRSLYVYRLLLLYTSGDQCWVSFGLTLYFKTSFSASYVLGLLNILNPSGILN